MPAFDPSPMELLFWNALALIAAACFFAPVFRRLGLGTILGYLAAGLAVQLAFSGSFSEHPEELLHFAEFGVVLFLFVIGLELRPTTLWAMRSDIFGLGTAQMLVCGGLLAIPALLLGLPVAAAAIIGLGLALSSTALVMQTLDERRQRASLYGRKSFSILLFQDLAIVPLLLLVAFLAPTGESLDLGQSLVQLAIALAAIAILVIVGKYLLDPLFHLLARSGMQEIMTASALGVVIGAALLMDVAGMSYAMGAFIAGVMLAESAYRHEVEANIEPFRGLFLGLFFMAVGLSLDLGAVTANWALILAAVPVAMTLKGLALYGVARLFKIDRNASIQVALALPQHGEFGFVLFAAAATAGLLGDELSSTLIAIVTLSMAVSPLVARLEPLFLTQSAPRNLEESFDDAKGRTLVIGFGRFGQVVSQPLFADGVEVTILDNDADRVLDAKRFGFRVHFGDGRRRDVLRAASAAEADLIVVCVDDPESADRIVALVKAEFAQAKLYVRSYDRRHSIRLSQADVDYSVRETFESALRLAEKVLLALGTSEEKVTHTIADIRERDLDRLRQQAEGGLQSGLDRLHVAPVRPEPLNTTE
ncbi:cation:proton antiporter domain-containing protein [Algihabitans albus]|uniref:cation:proton antiporter domain-containing protein n=1 Tax=Algihabitans albus TaxID=2164067 RepID=UPI001ABCB8B3|nr:cation:proton antiporter [Algihabitans albus]